MWEAIEDVELRLDLEAATKRLTAKQREAVALVLQGYTQEEIAERLDVSQPAIVCRVQTAVMSFRQHLINSPAIG